MLTTRCPDCQTTFRITSVALHAVAGEVRCGQCRAVFNAFDSLTDTRRTPGADAEHELQPEPQEAIGLAPHSDARPDGASNLNAEVPHEPGVPMPADTAVPPPEQADITAGQPTGESPERQHAAPLPEMQTQLLLQPPPGTSDDVQAWHSAQAEPLSPPPQMPREHAAEAASAATPAEPPITAAPAEPNEQPAADAPWRPSERRHRESGVWRIAAVLAALVLALQATHHFRDSLVGIPFFGAQLERVYALTGRPIEHNGSPVDFSIVDWTATAQQSDPAQPGRLEITAGVRNDTDSPLRYPMLLLELTDRWEAVVGARVFAPEEYMGTRLSQNARIGPATTVTAHLNLVDPGPAAYGFEVDVCVPASTGRMHCKSDLVFE